MATAVNSTDSSRDSSGSSSDDSRDGSSDDGSDSSSDGSNDGSSSDGSSNRGFFSIMEDSRDKSNPYRADAGGTQELFSEMQRFSKRPTNTQEIPDDKRLKTFEYLHGAHESVSEHLLTMTMQVWDRVVCPALIKELSLKGLALGCVLFAHKANKHNAYYSNGPAVIAIPEQKDDDFIRSLLLLMSGATNEAEKEREWQRIKVAEKKIWTLDSALIAPPTGTVVPLCSSELKLLAPCLLDYARELSEDLQELANLDDAAVAADTRKFQGWETIDFDGAERSAHYIKTCMLIECALMNLVHEVYSISSVAVVAIAASIALESFHWHASVPVFQAYLIRLTCRFSSHVEPRMCKVFEEKLRTLCFSPKRTCVVMKRWRSRAKENIVLAQLIPSEGEAAPMTPAKKRSTKYQYYLPVAHKRSGGARQKGVSKKRTEAEA